MPLENGQQGKDKQNPEHLRHPEEEDADKVAANDRETDGDAGGDPVTSQEPAQADKSYYAEASLTKKITVFSLTTVLILIALGLIYAYWPHGTPR